MVIQWSDEDQAYIVSFPEWEAQGLIGHTHGETDESAARKGREVLPMRVESAARGAAVPASSTSAPHAGGECTR
jgi:antitoxin HicB